jgi:hypothetical protein
MLHKAPASFGLVTFLLHEGLDRQKIKKHLLIFALSAPLATLLTYSILMNTSAKRLHEYNATGSFASKINIVLVLTFCLYSVLIRCRNDIQRGHVLVRGDRACFAGNYPWKTITLV